jgi:hypothetical protein
MLAVFLMKLGTSWWAADSPFKTIMLRDAGFSPEEIAAVYFTMSIVWGVLSMGSSIGLLLLNYFLGKVYELTRESTIVYIFLLVISILLGQFLGYAIRQFQLPQFPILHLGILAVIPSGLLSSITWNMLGILAGNYMREIEGKSEYTHPEIKRKDFGSQEVKEPTAPFGLSLVGGILSFISGCALLIYYYIIWGWLMGNGHWWRWYWWLSIIGLWLMASGIIVIVSSLMIYKHPERYKTWGTVILIFSLLGGGGIIGIVGGLLAINRASDIPARIPVRETTRICPKCGRVLAEDMKFCPYCGNELA